MTDLRKAAEDLLEGVEAAIKAGDWKVDGACDPDSAIVRLRQALAQPDEVLAEREACAKMCEGYDVFGPGTRERFAEAIRARSEKPPVKSYCGGKPNYCTPEQGNSSPNYPVSESSTSFVDAVNTSQERVDETAKREHEPVAWIKIRELSYMKAVADHGKDDWQTNLGLKPEPDDEGLYTETQVQRMIELLERCENEMRYAGWTKFAADNTARNAVYEDVKEFLK